VVHTGHATAKDVLGPYKEPVRNSWVDNRIDPSLFIDDDGKPYPYRVKFTDGKSLWGRPMEDPWVFALDPTYFLCQIPGKPWIIG
jgi:beta-xylosidase